MAERPQPAAEPRLRAARDADADGVIALIARCYAEVPPNVLDVDGEEPALRAPASRFERFWVLEAGGAVAGCVAAETRGAVAELKKFYVDRPLRGRGWGRRLMREAEDYARRRRCRAMELWSDTRFTRAHRVYAAAGYAPTGRTRELHDLSRTTEAHYRKELRADARG